MKHAICIGINDYSWLRPSASLRGCVADALDWMRLFRDTLVFHGGIHLLLNHAATAQAFRSAISGIAAQAQPGDTVAITYSGHGTRIPDEDGDEDDGYDEAIVLHGGIYSDDQIAGDLKMLPPGVRVLLVADSCHSGTVQRFLGLGTATDSLPKCVDILGVTPDAARARALHHRFGISRDGAPAAGCILLAGCMDAETSMDAFVGNAYHGALTFHAVRILEENPCRT